MSKANPLHLGAQAGSAMTRQERLRTEMDGLREEKERLKDALQESKEELRRMQKKERLHEQEIELTSFRAVREERQKAKRKKLVF